MLRKRLIIGVALLALLGAIAGCGVDVEQPLEPASIDIVQPSAETNTLTIQGRVIVDAYHYDAATGTYVLFYHHESSNLVVDLGLDWIEQQLGDSGTATTDTADWISLSMDATDPAAGWTVIVSEINTGGGLDRAEGTYDGTPGTGAWEIEKTFTADATYTDVQLTGLQWDDIGVNNLMAANKFTAVTLNNLDTLTVTWQLSVGP